MSSTTRLVSATLLLLPATILARDEPASDPPKDWTKEVAKSAELFTVHRDAEANEPLKMVSAYKWRNAARRVGGDRLLLLYVADGRPVASCKVYPTGQSIVHTFISFTDLPLVARRDGGAVWSPPESEPEFAPVSGAPRPPKSGSVRLLQMKALARQFSARTGPGEAKRQSTTPELRLLPNPLYRYEVEDAGGDGLVDGAAFAFVAEGGNPQMLLLLEAVREEGELEWRFGFTRRTFAKLEAFHEDQEVWTVEFLPARDRRSASSFHGIDLPVTD